MVQKKYNIATIVRKPRCLQNFRATRKFRVKIKTKAVFVPSFYPFQLNKYLNKLHNSHSKACLVSIVKIVMWLKLFWINFFFSKKGELTKI